MLIYNQMWRNNKAYFAVLGSTFLGMLGWWFYVSAFALRNTNQNYYYGLAQGLLPVIVAIFGLVNAKKWGGFNSSMGRAMIYLSTGLITWGIGTIVFAYYNIVARIAVPYPSVADGFYIVSWPLWVASMISLSKATGAKFQLNNLLGRLALFIVPVIILALSYYLLIVVARGGVVTNTPGDFLKMFFDLAYPVGDIVILTVALLIYGLSFNYLGGMYKWAIVIILGGFAINYIGDFSFVFTTTRETYYVANWVDLIYTIAFFLLELGVVLVNPDSLSKLNKEGIGI